ncbi:MAG: MBL fold metallo-hydrolase [Actinomycetota bacterium]|nr:MBL fold metallo-hydrolase [Actinomycetota bacterium]MDQ3574502.1 MBL fold metallo-hydrolase [Actinomycetota bacterium]
MGLSSFSITVLGCSGSYPGPDSACSGYLVRGGGVTVWLDAGSGTLANLQRHVSLHAVDAVVLSHEHPDHWSDVEGFRVACAHVIERTGVPVYATAGVGERLFPDEEAVLDWHVVTDGDEVQVGGLRLGFSRTDHPPETLAVRVDADGRSIAYSADTGPEWSFEALGPDIDLALCEATYLSDREAAGASHLSARQAGVMAREAGVGRLVLTHLWPVIDPEQAMVEGTAAYGQPVDVARSHAQYCL